MIERLQFFLIAIMLLGAPLIAGGKSTYSLLFLEITGLLLLGITLWQDTYRDKLSKLVWITLIFGILIPLLYLLPIPLRLWEALPGRSAFMDAVTWYNLQTKETPWLSLSLVPEKTIHAFLALIPLLAILLTTLVQTNTNLVRLTYLLIVLASIEALLGIAQYNTQNESLFPFGSHGNRPSGSDAIGSYINRDHFVALMYMTLPLALSQLFYRVGAKELTQNYKEQGIKAQLIIALILIILANLVLITGAALSRSRAGIFLAILGIVISTLVFARHIGGKRSTGLASTLIISSLGVIGGLGMLPILNRFIALDPFEDGRWGYFQVAIEGIQRFFPIGTGPSTFQDIYRTIQPYDQIGFLNHVHNDYLELIFECGIFGILFIILFFLAYLANWFNLRSIKWTEIKFIKIACGISTLLLLIHALVDFNFHTPANALVFSFLLAVFLRK